MRQTNWSGDRNRTSYESCRRFLSGRTTQRHGYATPHKLNSRAERVLRPHFPFDGDVGTRVDALSLASIRLATGMQLARCVLGIGLRVSTDTGEIVLTSQTP